ncbi:UDP-N-acetylglucosamine 2-epimerase [Fusibacter sp. JL216-2]|uniref:UDP-N-acetylglucosamine 2-epimerase n=1 Tax=Fusibacter sp. JL216-2 TaxID=3071453 RepID=UPI003D32DD7B
MKKIAFVTSSRADYSLLKPVMIHFRNSEEFNLQVIVTGSHLSQKHGYTINEILSDGFDVSQKIHILEDGDTANDICRSASNAMKGMSSALSEINPDLIVVLGDRFEIFSMAMAATIHRIPIAHLHGGEVTEGAMDECFRHSITKMSHLHFASTDEYRERIIQLGEKPEYVWNVGAVGVENVLNVKRIDKPTLYKDLSIPLSKKVLLVTYHPETLSYQTPQAQISELLTALSHYGDYFLVFTKANADTSGTIINDAIDEYISKHPHNSKLYASLGSLRYLNLVSYASAVIGNSSSGIIEVPSFKIPTVNIGDRQKGRVRSKSVIDVECKSESIKLAIEKAMNHDFLEQLKKTDNPYEKKGTSFEIFRIIMAQLEQGIEIQKKFYDL